MVDGKDCIVHTTERYPLGWPGPIVATHSPGRAQQLEAPVTAVLRNGSFSDLEIERWEHEDSQASIYWPRRQDWTPLDCVLEPRGNRTGQRYSLKLFQMIKVKIFQKNQVEIFF